MNKIPKLKQISIAIGICTMAFSLNAAKPVPPDYDSSLTGTLLPLDDAKTVFSRYSQSVIEIDRSGLSKGDQQALLYIIEAAKIMDKIFYIQKKQNNLSILDELTRPYYDPVYLKLFKINYSQWDSLVMGDEPFLNTLDGPIPHGINLYPQGLTQDEWDTVTADLPASDPLLYDFTKVERDKKTGKLIAVPYSEVYKKDLSDASYWLKKAAKVTTDPTLAKYLYSRIDAFKSNNYLESDKDWVNLKGDLAITIGPYEQYLDQFAGVKAAFMAHIAIVDKAETARLKYLEDKKQFLIDNLPYPSVCGPSGDSLCSGSDYSAGGLESPLVTVNEVYTAGDYRATPAQAFNLPNRAENRANGSKNTLIKNVADQGFVTIGILRAARILSPTDMLKMSADSSFLGVVTHEMGHALTPKTMVADGADVTVELGRWYLTIEEGLADASSVYNSKVLSDLGGVGNPYTGLDMESLYLSFLGPYFRENLWSQQNASSHRRGQVIALAHHLNFPDPCQAGKHAMDIDSGGILTINTSVPKCVDPSNQKSVMASSAEELVRKYLAIEMASNTSNDSDIEAARNLYACSKDMLWGSTFSDPADPEIGRTGRQAEVCVGATYPGNVNFKQAIQNIAAQPLIPLASYKVYPDIDPPFDW